VTATAAGGPLLSGTAASWRGALYGDAVGRTCADTWLRALEVLVLHAERPGRRRGAHPVGLSLGFARPGTKDDEWGGWKPSCGSPDEPLGLEDVLTLAVPGG